MIISQKFHSLFVVAVVDRHVPSRTSRFCLSDTTFDISQTPLSFRAWRQQQRYMKHFTRLVNHLFSHVIAKFRVRWARLVYLRRCFSWHFKDLKCRDSSSLISDQISHSPDDTRGKPPSLHLASFPQTCSLVLQWCWRSRRRRRRRARFYRTVFISVEQCWFTRIMSSVKWRTL